MTFLIVTMTRLMETGDDDTAATFRAAFMEGMLEKQSSEDLKLWKKRWFVMRESKLFYYKAESDVTEQKPTDEACCGVISMENIDSVTTAVRRVLLAFCFFFFRFVQRSGGNKRWFLTLLSRIPTDVFVVASLLTFACLPFLPLLLP